MVLFGVGAVEDQFYKGPYVYAGDLGRGFDVFHWSGEGPAPWVAQPEADLSASKEAPQAALVGDEVTYSIDVTNSGPDDATDVTLTDQLPEGDVEVLSTPEGCQKSDGTVIASSVETTPSAARRRPQRG